MGLEIGNIERSAEIRDHREVSGANAGPAPVSKNQDGKIDLRGESLGGRPERPVTDLSKEAGLPLSQNKLSIKDIEDRGSHAKAY